MRFLYCSVSMFLLMALFAVISATANTRNVKPSIGKLVLRLAYRNEPCEGQPKPYSIAMFETEESTREGFLAGTDWQGNIYVVDPLTSDACMLKRFDKNGRFSEAWERLSEGYGIGVGVSQSGIIWAPVEWNDAGKYKGLPVVGYRSGNKRPEADWRPALPDHVKKKICDALRKRGLEWQEGKDWVAEIPQCGGGIVSLKFSGRVLGSEQGIARYLWVLMREDSTEMQEVEIAAGSHGERTPSLAPDGKLYAVSYEFKAKHSDWSKVWLWERGKEKGEPLLDRSKVKEPWADVITLGKTYAPSVSTDAKGHIYLLWERNAAKSRGQPICMGGDTIFVKTSMGGEQALIVLDSQKRLVAYVPWAIAFVEGSDNWIKPLPDGSGFYRIQFCESEARIYFHPLPK